MSLFLTIYITLFCLLCTYASINNAVSTVDSLVACLHRKQVLNYTTSSSSTSFNAVLDFSLQNLRFTEAGVSKPGAIILPSTVKEVQRAWACVRDGGWALRVRNGGHSYEGLSSTASTPFVIIDLMNMHAITVNVAKKFVWVESGVRLGELYYAVASASSNLLGLSAGTCATIGISGHVMGGGYGMLSRKYGVAADNLLEAQVITANRTLIKKVSTSDPELFWALRGGGGGAWGIVVAWKLKLVSVPSTVTTFNVWRTGKQAVADLVFKWQSVAPAAAPELFIAIYMAGISSGGVADMGASFYGQNWGTIDQTMALFNSIYPELGLTASNCKQGNWIQAVASIAGLAEPAALLNRQQASRGYFKAKSDYVSKALTKQALAGAYDIMMNNTRGWMIFEPYGGVMSKIRSDEIAFPHRGGNLFVIQYQATWADDTDSPDNELIAWLRGLYSYMAPLVTYTPSRSMYVNYIDLEVGDSVSAGKSYFGSNFAKLVKIKARFDPSNIFNQPQSVPVSM
ncbi:hypothetical protein GOP47_0011258 [Adiantum capillus-veneris]|uniref:FAD-binding PCMH-type domain-containing protein n=1 Tax=Adiantum capillus-veneris TaxID=13818 RepID=A0A9D4USF7_ADICA|nr:hypothetical protein GOP47_0011258 [Adiantum capillus-veneris]